jgi:hypothetical protein
VFGIGGVEEGKDARAAPTNVTILFEGEQRLFATMGDDKCTVDSLTQQRVETLAPNHAVYRVEAHGSASGPPPASRRASGCSHQLRLCRPRRIRRR